MHFSSKNARTGPINITHVSVALGRQNRPRSDLDGYRRLTDKVMKIRRLQALRPLPLVSVDLHKLKKIVVIIINGINILRFPIANESYLRHNTHLLPTEQT